MIVPVIAALPLGTFQPPIPKVDASLRAAVVFHDGLEGPGRRIAHHPLELGAVGE